MRTNFILAFSVSGIPNHSVGNGLEALGDLARNRMAVAIHVANHAASDPPTSTSTEHHAPPAALPIEPPMPRIDNSPAPSVGVHAAAAELELVCGRTERCPRDWASPVSFRHPQSRCEGRRTSRRVSLYQKTVPVTPPLWTNGRFASTKATTPPTRL